MQSKNRFVIDGDNVLRAEGVAAGVAGNIDAAVKELRQRGAYWQADQEIVVDGEFDIVIDVNAIGTGSTPTLTFQLISCSDVSKSNPQIQATFPAVVGQLVIPVDQDALTKQDADATHWFLRAVAANSGGTAAPDYSAFIAPKPRS